MKLYENTTNSMRNNPEYYEKWLSVILFLIHHLSDNKRVIRKYENMRNEFDESVFLPIVCKLNL